MMRIYGSKISYFTDKLETYLRYKGINYERLPSPAYVKTIKEKIGALQMPVVEHNDGRWMADTMPIIQQLETEHPNPAVMPEDAVVRYIALLLEDYADEWLWWTAMHYRWSYSHDRELLSSIIVDELLTHIPKHNRVGCPLQQMTPHKINIFSYYCPVKNDDAKRKLL